MQLEGNNPLQERKPAHLQFRQASEVFDETKKARLDDDVMAGYTGMSDQGSFVIKRGKEQSKTLHSKSKQIKSLQI